MNCYLESYAAGERNSSLNLRNSERPENASALKSVPSLVLSTYSIWLEITKIKVYKKFDMGTSINDFFLSPSSLLSSALHLPPYCRRLMDEKITFARESPSGRHHRWRDKRPQSVCSTWWTYTICKNVSNIIPSVSLMSRHLYVINMVAWWDNRDTTCITQIW